MISRIYLKFRFIKKKYPTSPFKILKYLNKSQYWNNNKIRNYHIKTINNIIKYAKEHSYHYINEFINIKLPISNPYKIAETIPILAKKDVIINKEKLHSDKYSLNYIHTTSGSSGDPLSVGISGMAEAYRKASMMRFLQWWGLNIYDKSVLIWGVKGNESGKGNFINRIKSILRNRLDINVFDLSDKTIIKYFHDIEKFKPKYIRGYKSALLQFAELMDIKKLRFNKTKLRVAIVTSEVLFEEERIYIEKIFGCRVANEYGAAEAGLFAYECPEGRMHINEEAVLVNTNNKNEAIVTELFNDSMPLINYRIGDKIKISKNKCKCGRTSRTIENIEGRLNDYVIKPDGTKISQYVFYYIIKELDDIGFSKNIKKYKIIQKRNKFDILLVPDINYKRDVKKYIEKRVKQEIDENIDIKFHILSSIPREKSGKLRFFIREK